MLHARSEARAEATRVALPQAEAVLVGDLSTLAAMRDVADQANRRGRFDAVIHNAGIGYREPRRVETVDGLSQLWAVNVLAPYVLTALMHKPDRLVYLSSGMHTGGDPSLDDPQWSGRRWNGSQAYSDTKFHDVLLAFGVARRWPDVLSNALTPGWVPTRMGGAGRAGRPRSGPRDPGLAGGERRPGSAGDRELLLPPAAQRRKSSCARPRTAGPFTRVLPRCVRRCNSVIACLRLVTFAFAVMNDD